MIMTNFQSTEVIHANDLLMISTMIFHLPLANDPWILWRHFQSIPKTISNRAIWRKSMKPMGIPKAFTFVSIMMH